MTSTSSTATAKSADEGSAVDGSIARATDCDNARHMRAQGVRSLSVSSWLCHHGAVLRAGTVGTDARPNWKERAEQEDLTGVHGR
jgi:hypothetical protein